MVNYNDFSDKIYASRSKEIVSSWKSCLQEIVRNPVEYDSKCSKFMHMTSCYKGCYERLIKCMEGLTMHNFDNVDGYGIFMEHLMWQYDFHKEGNTEDFLNIIRRKLRAVIQQDLDFPAHKEETMKILISIKKLKETYEDIYWAKRNGKMVFKKNMKAEYSKDLLFLAVKLILIWA